MGEAKVYSERLGRISDAQFEAVAERLGLGRFLKAEPTTSGLFGQNVFVSTTEGEFVLRGAPHWVKGLGEKEWRREDRWQFTKEVFFARQLHEQTKAPVPWPMLHDESNDIFGWPYLVMPRMPGTCFDERGIRTALSVDARRQVAIALGSMLAEMQKLTWPFAGDFAPNVELLPYPGGYSHHVVRETHDMMSMAQVSGSITSEDVAWIDDTAAQALSVSGGDRPSTYVHCDYKLDNLAVTKDGAVWRVSGLFDLHESRFGDGALDLVRQTCSYLDTDVTMARIFVDSYRSHVTLDQAIDSRMPLYIINDRMKFWEYFTRPENRASWSQGKTFRGWAQRYVNAILELL
ncbi:MAG: phosphotransferase family protein [Rhizomicrobium sp.]